MTKRLLISLVIVIATLRGLSGGISAGELSERQKNDLRREYVLANTEFTVLHEFGHAAFDAFDVPLFSCEEESADTVATIFMIINYDIENRLDRVDRLLMVSAEWYQEWMERDRKRPMQPYWDNHPLSIERFYNINCLAMGANQELLSLSLDTKLLPVERGWSCDQEFARAKRTVEWLGKQHARNPEHSYRSRPPKLTVVYQEPATPEKLEVYRLLRASAMLERITTTLDARVDWPFPITLSVEDCGGSPDAFYKSEARTIFLCTDLLAEFSSLADSRASQGLDDLCLNPAIYRVMGTRLNCPTPAGKGETAPSP